VRWSDKFPYFFFDNPPFFSSSTARYTIHPPATPLLSYCVCLSWQLRLLRIQWCPYLSLFLSVPTSRLRVRLGQPSGSRQASIATTRRTKTSISSDVLVPPYPLSTMA
jgi:hypothetical protein